MTDDKKLVEEVAEKVMGYEIDSDPLNEMIFVRKSGEREYWWFSPLTNANHWMMVVEAMREKGWKFRMDGEDKNEYSVNFIKEIPCKLIGYGYEELNYDGVGSPGHAVCLAAKAALESERGMTA
jgi:hypothetical protein